MKAQGIGAEKPHSTRLVVGTCGASRRKGLAGVLRVAVDQFTAHRLWRSNTRLILTPRRASAATALWSSAAFLRMWAQV